MKKIFFFGLFLSILASCTQNEAAKIEATNNLTSEEQKAFLYEIARYIGELPKNGGYETRASERFDAYYRHQAEQSKLKYFYQDAKSGTTYFMITQIAPSIHEKYVALGGKLKRSSDNNIEEYQEIFRTWKFPSKELEPKAEMLFRKMITGDDLSAYYSNKMGDQYIEFPNDYTKYDIKQRRWVPVNNPLDSLYHLREQKLNTSAQ